MVGGGVWFSRSLATTGAGELAEVMTERKRW